MSAANKKDPDVREFIGADFRKRDEAATSLVSAIAICEREDAVVILTAALADLSSGAPLPLFTAALDEARWWASFTTPHELKAYLLACFEALNPEVRVAFLRYVQKRVAE